MSIEENSIRELLLPIRQTDSRVCRLVNGRWTCQGKLPLVLAPAINPASKSRIKLCCALWNLLQLSFSLIAYVRFEPLKDKTCSRFNHPYFFWLHKFTKAKLSITDRRQRPGEPQRHGGGRARRSLRCGGFPIRRRQRCRIRRVDLVQEGQQPWPRCKTKQSYFYFCPIEFVISIVKQQKPILTNHYLLLG